MEKLIDKQYFIIIRKEGILHDTFMVQTTRKNLGRSTPNW